MLKDTGEIRDEKFYRDIDRLVSTKVVSRLFSSKQIADNLEVIADTIREQAGVCISVAAAAGVIWKIKLTQAEYSNLVYGREQHGRYVNNTIPIDGALRKASDLRESLLQARGAGNKQREADLLETLGAVIESGFGYQVEAVGYFEGALVLRESLHDRVGIRRCCQALARNYGLEGKDVACQIGEAVYRELAAKL